MKLILDFDDELLKRYAQRGAEAFFTLYWRLGDNDYPERDWMDFGLVLLNGWFEAVWKLKNGSSQEQFIFIEAPCRLLLRSDKNELQIQANDEELHGHTTVTELIEELRKAALTAQQKMILLGIDDPELKQLQINLRKSAEQQN